MKYIPVEYTQSDKPGIHAMKINDNTRVRELILNSTTRELFLGVTDMPKPKKCVEPKKAEPKPKKAKKTKKAKNK